MCKYLANISRSVTISTIIIIIFFCLLLHESVSLHGAIVIINANNRSAVILLIAGPRALLPTVCRPIVENENQYMIHPAMILIVWLLFFSVSFCCGNLLYSLYINLYKWFMVLYLVYVYGLSVK